MVGRDLIVVGRVWIGCGYVVYTLWIGHVPVLYGTSHQREVRVLVGFDLGLTFSQ